MSAAKQIPARDHWESLAAKLEPRTKAFIGGRFVDAASGQTFDDNTTYGLAASVWTCDIRTAHRVARALRAGAVWVNTFNASEITTPFGGMKQSGTGRDRSLHAIGQYTHLKTTWIDLS